MRRALPILRPARSPCGKGNALAPRAIGGSTWRVRCPGVVLPVGRGRAHGRPTARVQWTGVMDPVDPGRATSGPTAWIQWTGVVQQVDPLCGSSGPGSWIQWTRVEQQVDPLFGSRGPGSCIRSAHWPGGVGRGRVGGRLTCPVRCPGCVHGVGPRRGSRWSTVGKGPVDRKVALGQGHGSGRPAGKTRGARAAGHSGQWPAGPGPARPPVVQKPRNEQDECGKERPPPRLFHVTRPLPVRIVLWQPQYHEA